jgi:hypothetical protein
LLVQTPPVNTFLLASRQAGSSARTIWVKAFRGGCVCGCVCVWERERERLCLATGASNGHQTLNRMAAPWRGRKFQRTVWRTRGPCIALNICPSNQSNQTLIV